MNLMFGCLGGSMNRAHDDRGSMQDQNNCIGQLSEALALGASLPGSA